MKKVYIVGLLFLFLISFLFDKDIVLLLNLIRVNFLYNFLLVISFLGNWFFILILISLLFLFKRKEFLLPFWTSFLITGLLTIFLKYVLNRPRPFEVLNLGVTHTFLNWNSSFPSWHAASVFLVLPFLYLGFPKLRRLWIFFSVLVAFSRIYIGVHYLSDVFGGALLGLSVSYLIIFLKNKFGK